MTEPAQANQTPYEALAEFRAHKGDLWAYCVDLDLQTVLALTRALTRTMLDLSPATESSLSVAIKREIGILEGQGNPTAATVATALKQYLPAD